MSPDYNFGQEPDVSGAERKSGNRFLVIVVAVSFLFLVLKLTHAIDWSWWWIFAPIWIPFALGFLLALGKAADK